jgi:hypothetical protein
MNYPEVSIGLFVCCLLGPTSICVVMSVCFLIFSGSLVQAKIEVSSLAPEYIIKPVELRFPIGLPTD